VKNKGIAVRFGKARKPIVSIQCDRILWRVEQAAAFQSEGYFWKNYKNPNRVKYY
jgi:hypothetical protein